MAKNRQKARQIAQAQKQRQQEKALAPPSPPALAQTAATAGGRGTAQTAGNLERKVTVRLDADRFAQLESYARREGFTVSVIVRHLLFRFLDEQRRFPGARVL
jgi:uncharacterized protein (DUF4415 family)